MSVRQWSGVTVVSWIFGIVIALAGRHGTAFAQGTVAPPRAALSVWDTGRCSAKPLAPEDVEQRNGWKPIAASLVPGPGLAEARLIPPPSVWARVCGPPLPPSRLGTSPKRTAGG